MKTSMSFALTRFSALSAKTTLSSPEFDHPSRRSFLPPNRVGLKIYSSSMATDSEPGLSFTINGLKMSNPFVIGSSPPGCERISSINTIMSVMGIDLKMLHPEPCVEGEKDCSLSGIGGVEIGYDTAEFILLRSNTVCTGVMVHGYGHVKTPCTELQDFMKQHNFSTIEEFRGYGQLYLHIFVVAYLFRKAERRGLKLDKDWTRDGFVKEAENMLKVEMKRPTILSKTTFWQ
ncbi:unnamed protein product [Eruca vesicaria subsp. sativa]|uniref:Uncharacterized protein n=1 Tax=Eruca vesicaria subsp. sativa TaxID=29727 RepID=A0ABC8KTQ9_ERUVS|nr:unnamed protein product [Eruca vesicaria subsp. sativa]